MQKAEKKLLLILKKSVLAGVKPEEILNLKIINDLYFDKKYFFIRKYKTFFVKVFCAVIFCYLFMCLSGNISNQCLFEMPIDSSKVFRKSEDCKICHGVKEVTRMTNISKTAFEKSYAHTGVPVVISDGAIKWPAVNIFTYDFFKQTYNNNNQDMDNECQFFPYKTEFKSLMDVFNMSAERAKLLPGSESWYIGWSNCNDEAGKILRKYYSQPYFLPQNSENIALSWIFMGGPGKGAHMHVDNVVHPSWQAQLRGKKIWKLMPPPECYYQCSELSVTVHPGEIIVVDTNKWYHQTTILEGDVSITIGSEFD